MANHVNTYVSLVFDNEEAGKAKLQELYSRLDGWGEENKYDWNLHDIFGVPETDELDEHGNATGPGTYSWNIEHMGAKWAYIEDADEDGFRIVSAWGVPTDAVEFIVKELAEVDPDVRAEITAEDEMPNWVYAAVADSDGIYDAEEWQWEEIIEHLRDTYTEISSGWDDETDDFSDNDAGEAARDFMYDVLWEEISEWQMGKIEEMI
jgi:hypothetical protein